MSTFTANVILISFGVGMYVGLYIGYLLWGRKETPPK